MYLLKPGLLLLFSCIILISPVFAEQESHSPQGFSSYLSNQCITRPEMYDPQLMAETMANPKKFKQFMAAMSQPQTMYIMMSCASNPEQWTAWMMKITDPNKMMNTMMVFMNPQFYVNWMNAFMNPAFYKSM